MVLVYVSIASLPEKERRSLVNVARALSYFARVRAYGYVDRLANTFSMASLRQVLAEAIRDLKSEYDRGEQVFMPTATDVETFIALAERDLSIAKVAASMALAYSWSKPAEERGENEKGILG
ncbi:MAG: hypothetical protein QXL30_04705 [Sulfolobales archaeon]